MYRSERWEPLINRAQSQEQLVAIVREYLATWLPSDLERLPAECRLGDVSHASEIATAAVTVAQFELKGGLDEQGTEMLRHMAHVLIAAQLRLRQILGRVHDPAGREASDS